MRILFLTTHFNTGGITSYILTLARGLISLGHTVFVVSSGGNEVSALEEMGGKHIVLNIRTKSELSPRIYWHLPHLKEIIETYEIDILHAQTRVTQVMGFLVSKLTGKSFVTTFHGFFNPRLSRKIFPCYGEGMIAISQAVKEHLVRDFCYPANKIFLVRHGIDLTKLKPTTELVKNKGKMEYGMESNFCIGIVARLSTVKGHRYIIEAMPAVLSKIPHAKLLIVGEGHLEGELRQQVADLKLNDFVLFYKTSNRAGDFYSIFDVFVMPSLQEGLGLSVMEAQAAGVPVVASRVGGLPSLIEHNHTGLLVDSQNPQALSSAVCDLFFNPDKATDIVENARRFVEQGCDVNHMLKKTEEVYQEILEKGR